MQQKIFNKFFVNQTGEIKNRNSKIITLNKILL